MYCLFRKYVERCFSLYKIFLHPLTKSLFFANNSLHDMMICCIVLFYATFSVKLQGYNILLKVQTALWTRNLQVYVTPPVDLLSDGPVNIIIHFTLMSQVIYFDSIMSRCGFLLLCGGSDSLGDFASLCIHLSLKTCNFHKGSGHEQKPKLLLE